MIIIGVIYINNMNFELQPQITKSFLLSKHSEETYMTYYLDLPIKKGLFKNPLVAFTYSNEF